MALSEQLKTADYGLCLYLNGLCRNAWVGILFRVISRLGNGVFWYVLGLTLPFITTKNGLLLCGIYFAMGLIGVAVYKHLKAAWVRERPFVDHKQIFKACPVLDRYSFPSGHTLHAVAFTVLVILNEPVLAPILIPFTLLIGLSRPILGLHYPSDVVIGAALGATLGLIAHNVFIWLG